MRAVHHYSGQLSSRHRGDETDPYARHDYDATHCPAIFTGLPPFQIRYHLIDKGPADSRYIPHHLNRFAGTYLFVGHREEQGASDGATI